MGSIRFQNNPVIYYYYYYCYWQSALETVGESRKTNDEKISIFTVTKNAVCISILRIRTILLNVPVSIVNLYIYTHIRKLLQKKKYVYTNYTIKNIAR